MPELTTRQPDQHIRDAVAAGSPPPDITVFYDFDFQNQLLRTSLNVVYLGDDRSDKVSSFIVHSGVWKFYDDREFGLPFEGTFGPGYYSKVMDYGITNDHVSSFKPISV